MSHVVLRDTCYIFSFPFWYSLFNSQRRTRKNDSLPLQSSWPLFFIEVTCLMYWKGCGHLLSLNECPAYNFSLKKYFIKHKSSRIKEIISKSEQVVNVELVLLVLGNIWKCIWRIKMDAVKWVWG